MSPPPLPRVPAELHPLAREILEGLEGRPEAEAIVLGGGVALQHYCPFRQTRDLDAWWRKGVAPEVEAVIHEVIGRVAERHGLTVGKRVWSETQSYELKRGAKKIFSFQISLRDVELEAPLESSWAPVRIETFRDNLGAKMNALVGRGAPRDFLDVFEICRRGLADAGACWQAWSDKNPGRSPCEAKVNALRHLEAIESRRPLASIPAAERANAEAVRSWVRDGLCGAP
jgi:hypothetical protein